MPDYFVMKICTNEQCKQQEPFIQTKTAEGTVRLSELLTKESNEFCFLCDTPLRYEVKEVRQQVMQEETKLGELVVSFIQQQDDLMLKRHESGRSISWAIVTEEVDDYEKRLGKVATIYPRIKEENMLVVVETDFYPKEILHMMTRGYELDYIDWDYDQLAPPHWDAVFVFKEEEKLVLFLEEIWTFKQAYDEMGYKRNLDQNYYYYSIVEKKNEEGEWVCQVCFVEQDDWIHFDEFIYEHYHGASLPIREVMKDLQADDLNDSTFTTTASYEEVIKVLGNHPHFDYDETFDQCITARK